MPTIRERFEHLLAGDKLADLERQVAQLAEMNQRIANAYEAGVYELPPQELVRQLTEFYDPALVADLVDRMNWETISGYGGYSEDERARAVQDSKRMFKYAIIPRWTVNLWTYYGLGSNVSIVAEDPAADEVWQAFWTADRNQRVLAKDRMDELSRWLLVTGERFHVFFASTLDGETTIRSVEPAQITAILTNPDDSAEPWFYERQYTTPDKAMKTLYYPDWELFFAQGDGRPAMKDAWETVRSAYTVRGDLAQADNTAACMLFTPFVQVDEESLRGWPLLAPHGTAWMRAQREFMQDRAAVTKAVAAFVRRYTVSGGSRAVDSVRRTLASAFQFGGTSETNPPPVAGSSEVTNRAVDVTDLPLRSGATDAKSDGEMFAWMAGLAGGVFPHYLGLGDAYRLATATAMEQPIRMQFSLYRNQLGAMLRKMVRIVLQYEEKYNGASFDNYNVDVSTDRLVEADLNVTTEAVSRVFRDVLVATQEMGDGLPPEARRAVTVFLVQKVLEAFGAQDVSEMIDLDMYAQEPEEPETQEAGLAEMLRTYMPHLYPATEEWQKGDIVTLACGDFKCEFIYEGMGELRMLSEQENATPRGQPLPPWEGQVPITPDDVAEAIVRWNQEADESLAGALETEVEEPEGGEEDTGG